MANKIQIIENYLNIFYQNRIRYNEVKNDIEIQFDDKPKYIPLGEREFNDIKKEIMNYEDIKLTNDDLKTVINSSYVPLYNPYIEYFNLLPKWDKKDYIKELSNTLKCSNQEFVEWSLIRWLIALVASLLDDAIINQEVPILVGYQGIGKSTWIAKLIPEPLTDYVFSGTISTNKDDTQLLTRCMLIDLDEITNLNKKESTRTKQLITRREVSLRPPYGKLHLNFPRRASFIGSTNEINFLYDLSGSRRFLCYDVEEINLNHSINLDMLYAQVLELYKKGTKHWFDGAEIEKINANNEQFRVVSLLEQEVIKKVHPIQKSSKKAKFFTATELAKELNIGSNYDVQQLGRLLTRLKFETKKIDGSKKYAVFLYKAD